MPNFKDYNQSQLMLLPPNIRDLIPADHICHVISEVVDNLDINVVKATYANDLGGASAYSPRLLIKIMFYGYSLGIRSSRLLEKRCREDLVFRYLSAGECPDHGTINLFRKKHLTNLETLFAQVVLLCGKLHMTDFSDISIDGSIFKASASKKNTFNREEISKWKNKMKKILKSAEEVDKEEDKKYGKKNRGYDQLPPKLADPETRKREIKRLMDKMNKLNMADKTIKAKQEKVRNETALIKKGINHNNHNIIDRDANLMKLKNSKAVKPSFNGQISTNNQIILAYDITTEAIDGPSLFSMIKKTQTNTKHKVKIIKADCGYWSRENMEQLEKTEINAYIPDRRKSYEEKGMRDGTLNKYHRNHFKYDKKKDEFVCPQGKRLKLKIINRDKFDKTKIISQRYFADNCATCHVKQKCTKAKNKQICIDWRLERLKTEMRSKLNGKKGKAKYIERMYDVEPVFGNIKHNQKMTEFLCRGKPMVKKEFGLSCIAHNFIKIANWIKNEQNKQQFDMIMKSGAVTQ